MLTYTISPTSTVKGHPLTKILSMTKLLNLLSFSTRPQLFTPKAQATKENKINWTASKLETLFFQGKYQESKKTTTELETTYVNCAYLIRI